MKTLKALASECDLLIKTGRVDEATKLLAELNLARVPRKWRLPIARLCRRTDQIAKGLKLLTPIVRSERSSIDSPATPHEVTEYAALLQRCGSGNEALSLLKSVDHQEVPEAHLFSAFCHFNSWDYDRAIPCLEAYIQSEQRDYQALVGRVNLAAALVATGRYESATELLKQNIATARTANHLRLLGNCMEMLAQVHLHSGDADACEAALAEANLALGGAQTLDSLFVSKWKALLQCLRSGSSVSLIEFRNMAIARGDSESVREADLYKLKICFDQREFDHLYFGTPFRAYRDRICRELASGPSGLGYVFGAPASPCFDLKTALISGHEAALPQGGKIHGLIVALLSDLYRPKRIGELFAQLFPNEHFNIFTSPGRVNQLLYRLQSWLTERDLPVRIARKNGYHSLRIHGEFSFMLHLDGSGPDKYDSKLQALRSAFPEARGFTVNEAKELLGTSLATTKRILASGLQAGQLDKFGASTATVYFFPIHGSTERLDTRHSSM